MPPHGAVESGTDRIVRPILMIDLETTQIIGLAMTVIEALVALLIWSGHRHMAGIGRIVICFLILPCAHALGSFIRTSPGIVLGNCGVNLSITLYAVGLAEILGRQRAHSWTIPTTLLGTMVIWSAALLLAPDNVLLRILAFGVFLLAINIWMLVMLWQDRTLSRIVKGTLAIIILSQGLAQILRTAQAWSTDAQTLLAQPSPGWFVLTSLLYSNLLFFYVIAIIAGKILQSAPDQPDLSKKTRIEDNENWSLCATNWEVTPPGKSPVKLTSTEYMLLAILAEQEPGTPLPREAIFAHLPRNGLNSPNNLDALVRRVRKKIKDGSDLEIPLKTIYGVGYTLTVPVRQTPS